MSPRCPGCGYLTTHEGRCAVCAAGVPVRRLLSVDVVAYHNAVNAALHHTMRLASQASHTAQAQTRRRRSPGRPRTRPPKPAPADAVQVSCGAPGCPRRAIYSANGLARLLGQGKPPLCAGCRDVQKRRYQDGYNTRRREASASRGSHTHEQEGVPNV